MPRVANSVTVAREKDRQLIATITYYQTLMSISDDRIASAAGFTKRTLYNRRKNPDTFSIGELRRISKALRIPTEELQKGI